MSYITINDDDFEQCVVVKLITKQVIIGLMGAIKQTEDSDESVYEDKITLLNPVTMIHDMEFEDVYCTYPTKYNIFSDDGYAIFEKEHIINMTSISKQWFDAYKECSNTFYGEEVEEKEKISVPVPSVSNKTNIIDFQEYLKSKNI